MVEYLLTNDTQQNSIHTVSTALNVSYDTVNDYINYVKQVYLFFEVRNFDYSLKKQLASNIKYYAIDTGFMNAVSFSFSENVGRLYENVVFNEIIQRGKTIFFLNANDHECDFITKEGNRVTAAYQVCYDINEKNLDREVTGLITACKKYGLAFGYIITASATRKFREDDVEIRMVPITGFLLGVGDGV